MSFDRDRDPITRPIFACVEVTAQLTIHGDNSLVTAIQEAMNGRRPDDDATFALSFADQIRLNDILQGWLGDQDLDSGTHLATT